MRQADGRSLLGDRISPRPYHHSESVAARNQPQEKSQGAKAGMREGR